MKLTVNKYLNARTGTPSVEAPNPFYKSPGDIVEIIGVEFGQKYDGSSIWYLADDGQYYWSGGFQEVEWYLPNNNSDSMPLENQFTIISEAIDFLFDKFKQVYSINGLSVEMKQNTTTNLSFYSMVFHVEKKQNTINKSISESVSYRGLNIPKREMQASTAKASGPGESIARLNGIEFGTAGFVGKKNGKKYIVTNYHVLCYDLMSQNPRVLNLDGHLNIKNLQVTSPMKSPIIGNVIEGRLDMFNDIALVELNQDQDFKNVFHGIGEIVGYTPIKSLTTGQNVTKYGATEPCERDGQIISFNVKKSITYLNGSYTTTIGGLIQCSLFSSLGDSGSVVLNDDNQLVGLIVAIDDSYTYVIPIVNIIQNFNIQLQ